jgi:Holliday junction DNA helicase RuvA
MIGRLRGLLATKRSDGVVIDVMGIGYEVSIPIRTLASLPPVGEEIALHTHLHVREDVMTLFGFSTERDQEVFRILLSGSGIGPKVALAMLSAMTSNELHIAIVSEDLDGLCAVPGIGKRSAQKIVLELKPKLSGLSAVGSVSGSGRQQTREALEGLGYASAEIAGIMGDVDPDVSVAEQIRMALQALGARGTN